MFTLGGTAAWPLAVRAQHTVDPVIGFLSSVDPASLERAVSAFHQGLDHTGFIEGRNVTVTYKWAMRGSPNWAPFNLET